MGDLFAAIPGEVITSGGFAGLVFLAVWMLLTGRIVPKSTLDQVIKDRDGWRQVAETEQATGRIQASSLDKLVASAQAQERLMQSLHNYLQQQQGGR